MIYLAQTDTTAGFLSKDYKEINLAKKREINKPCIITSAYLTSLKNLARVPNKFKNQVRKAKKTTFIYKNQISFRLVNDNKHSLFLKNFKYLYSSSANLHGYEFDINYAKNIANVIVDLDLAQKSSSKMFKINNSKLKQIR
ncbi:Sua5 YciO YrdC YwlC family protein [Campylobacter sp. RM12651]|uniref:Sua5 YciO YrdC YwlC family protein n=1 Tax=Campylobacter sp. RM12651 TaxID=1660079 RepID=UPI001EFB95A8|nr:Sua5 YciO YrdC YwlC family protein [Campylobacter sp. RM12651]ULO04401.1 threonylcarbamoyl-AMP synthase TsaC [Campylobacter sp. RM12651]